MAQKPEIQYIGQFYVYGSEAPKIEEQPRKARTRLPLEKLEQIEQIYVDPVALVGIAVAVVMLVSMVVGMLQIRADWSEYQQTASTVSLLKWENAELELQYRTSYDLAEIEKKALGLGLVPKSEVESMAVYVSIPEPVPARTMVEDMIWFWEGLFA